MAISAATQWEVRTTGSNTNGGAFKAGASGTDWSQQDAAQYAVTDAVTNGTTTITSATANFGTDVVGNVLYIQGGTGSITADRYEVMSRTSATAIVVDRSTGLTTGTGATLNLGGGLLTIAQGIASMVTGNTCWVKAGTYTITANINFNQGNSLPSVAPVNLIGYNTTHGDTPTGTDRPLISTSSVLNPMVSIATGNRTFANFRLDGTDTATTAISMGSGTNMRGGIVVNCYVERVTNTGISAGSSTGGGAIIACEVTDLTAGASAAISQGICHGCYVHDSPGVGYSYPNVAVNCVADTMGGDGFRFAGLEAALISHCISYGNGGDGFEAADTYSAFASFNNNIAVNNGAWGFRTDKAQYIDRPFQFDYNAAYNNTSGARQNFIIGPNDVILTADPFTDAPNGDFSLNDTAGGGADLKGVGFPATFPVT